MKFKTLLVDFSQVNSLEKMHESLARLFGFPDFYGKNVNALIDCWSSMRFPEDGMSTFTLDKDELLLLEVKGLSSFNEIMMNHFIISIESVNQRYIQRDDQPLIFMLPL